jgi:Undecaprenyl-phosphate galactose phosphotransferase WbaP
VIEAIADRKEAEVVEVLTQGSLIPNLVVLNSNVMMPTMWVEPFDAAGLPGVHIRDRLLSPMQRLVKRAMDVSFGIVALVVSLPIFLVVGLWIKAVSPGPVFYRHHGRIGRRGQRFGALKIRTMITNSKEVLRQHLESNSDATEEWNMDLKLKNDPGFIPGVGHFLRRTSLDELPQFWNVLRGEMSLVGPRPIVPQEVEKYSEFYPLYQLVRPGMTGVWQVSGRNNTSDEERVRLDSYYVRNWSLWLDYFVLLRTVSTVLFRESSY